MWISKQGVDAKHKVGLGFCQFAYSCLLCVVKPFRKCSKIIQLEENVASYRAYYRREKFHTVGNKDKIIQKGLQFSS